MSESIREIFVEILEGVEPPVFAPVSAIHLGKNFYKILPTNRNDLETLRFKTNCCVYCLDVKFENKENLVPVAYSEISEQAVKYILGFTNK